MICFAFSLPPNPFIKTMNRATANQAEDQGKEEGVESRKLAWKRVADEIIQDEFGFDDLEWGWNDGRETEAAAQSEIDDRDIKNGSKTIDEVRDARGLGPVDGGDKSLIFIGNAVQVLSAAVEASLNPPEPPPQLVPGAANDQAANGNAPPPAKNGAPAGKDEAAAVEQASNRQAVQKLAKAAFSPIRADRPKAKRAQRRIAKTVATELKTLGRDVAAYVDGQLRRLGKASDGSEDTMAPVLAGQIAAGLDLGDLGKIGDGIFDDLFEVVFDGAELGLAQVGVNPADNHGRSELFDRVNDRAVKAAREQGAKLVSQITDSTRRMVAESIAKGLEENIGRDAIASALETSYAFSSDRAGAIAQNEIADANSKGALEGYREARSLGVQVKKSWLTAGDDKVDDECVENEAQGPIDLDDTFQDGSDAPPGHVDCRCAVVPEVEDDADNADARDGENIEDLALVAKGSDQPREDNGRFASTGLSKDVAQAVNGYTGNDYKGINGALRTGGAMTEARQQTVDTLDKAIAGSTFKEDGTVYRGLASAAAAAAERQGLSKGSVIKDAAFQSVSQSEDVAKLEKSFAEQSRTGIKMEIAVKAGQNGLDVSRVSDFREEREVLLPRNSSFRVVSWAPKSRTLRVELM